MDLGSVGGGGGVVGWSGASCKCPANPLHFGSLNKCQGAIFLVVWNSWYPSPPIPTIPTTVGPRSSNLCNEEGIHAPRCNELVPSTNQNRLGQLVHHFSIGFYLDVKDSHLDTEKRFACQAVSRSFLSI